MRKNVGKEIKVSFQAKVAALLGLLQFKRMNATQKKKYKANKSYAFAKQLLKMDYLPYSMAKSVVKVYYNVRKDLSESAEAVLNMRGGKKFAKQILERVSRTQ